MEPSSSTRHPTTSGPESSRKRTSSPSVPMTGAKRPRTDPRQVLLDRDKRSKRRRKKQLVARDLERTSGHMQNEHSSSLVPGPSLSMTNLTERTESRPSFVSSRSGTPFDFAPLVHSQPPAMPSSLKSDDERPASRASLQQDHSISQSSLHDHEALITSLLSSLECQICLELLHQPFALSPCGHISCYNCLVNWFKADQHPDVSSDGPVFRKKTCPHCRAIVRERPIEAWNVKDMVAAVVKSGFGRYPRPSVEIRSEVVALREFTDLAAPPRDPWVDIFPPLQSRPGFPHFEGPPDALGVFDAEDQVYRCLDCLHEIWGDSCSQCGRHHPGHGADASDDDESDEERNGIWSILPVMEHIMGWSHGDGVNESEDESYEASFIDDGDDSEGSASDAVEISCRVSGEVQIMSSNEDDEEVGDTDESQNAQRRPAIRRARRRVLSDSGEIDGEMCVI
ncbi:hypothetical protein B0F90DRAFT_1702157 [Multifurca ochricompacta]|uniref:RING-type domain-containing protein n=1 Tax=Multifurca ochricompacta TaxID=376703 RepID=A0AAD4M9P7_9AGAM|nr:hypothetical protein B0F90DRAFT_1702157 [Multifurca ochricompacta]